MNRELSEVMCEKDIYTAGCLSKADLVEQKIADFRFAHGFEGKIYGITRPIYPQKGIKNNII